MPKHETDWMQRIDEVVIFLVFGPKEIRKFTIFCYYVCIAFLTYQGMQWLWLEYFRG